MIKLCCRTRAIVKKAGLAIIVALVITMLAACTLPEEDNPLEGVTIDLDDYLIVTFSGTNGEGTAEISFDGNRFDADYAEKLILDWEKLGSDYKDHIAKIEATDEIRYLVGCEMIAPFFEDEPLFIIENDGLLKNGDEIKIIWNFIEGVKLEEYFNCKFKYGERIIKVEGLEEN